MKKAIVVLATLFLLSVSAQAQTGGMMHGHEGQAGHGMMGGEQMPMMEHMKTHGMMMQDMMQMMTDIMKMQKRIVEGVKPAGKKEMQKELSQMMERMDEMMAEMKGMARQGMMMQGMMGEAQGAGPKKEEQKSGGPLKTQERAEAGVTAKVDLESTDGTIRFKVTLETHTVELDKYKFDEIVVLRAGGKEYKGRVKSEEGSGHHRSAAAEFDNPMTKEVEIVIKDVAGVKERVFRFAL